MVCTVGTAYGHENRTGGGNGVGGIGGSGHVEGIARSVRNRRRAHILFKSFTIFKGM